jgi:hypothetical protein
MENKYWERCPYYAENRCPHSSEVDRAYLIPHILSPAETDEVKYICRKCGLYLDEKRKYIRLGKPFEVLIGEAEKETEAKGRIVNVSGLGALVTLEVWPDFVLGQTVQIKIYPRQKSSEEPTSTAIKASGEIKRIYEKHKQVAIMFLEEVKQEFLLEL